ncbi:muts domain V-domain-containing protein [Obelidium mucronatum]|nr:muts domain V-domain-containing protein [Obelidium mucronatum]
MQTKNFTKEKMRPATAASSASSAPTSARLGARPSTAASAAAGGVVVAVCEGRGAAPEVAVVCFDKAAGELSLSQFADSLLYAKTLQQLHLVDPTEILVSNTVVEPIKTRIIEILERNFGSDLIVPINRSYFNQTKGLQSIQDLSLDDVIIPGLSSKLYFAASCVAAVLTFVEERDDITFYRHSLKFKFFSVDGTMSIDHITARNLELTINLKSHKSTHSLFGILNKSCQTSMGSRFLRMNVLQPLCNMETISARLDSVEELKNDQRVLTDLRTAMKAAVDLDSLISTLLYRPKKHTVKVTEGYINGIITLKHVISKWIASIHENLEDSRSELLQVIRMNLQNDSLTRLLELINDRINEDITFQKSAQGMRNQRCYAIKAGWNGLLDVARQTYRESTNDVYDLVTQYNTTFGYQIKTNFAASQGFTFKLSVADLEGSDTPNLPMEFINVVKTKKTIGFTTLALLGLNDRINESLTEVYLMSDRIISELVFEIAKYASSLYKISESIALLDVLTAFAFDADMKDRVRPEFTETYAIKAGRHPIKEQIVDSTGSEYVPNDVYCCDGSNVQIISGPNMSGKTTYLKMVVLLNILAQMGSFVPAEYASFRLQSQVFSRIGCDSVVEASASSFMSEMREAAFILQNVCDSSLVVIDELGRGTSHSDGVAMSIAITEELARTKAFLFLATHFTELGAALTSNFPNVVKLHLQVECINRGSSVTIQYKYQIQDGSPTLENYGLTIAKIVQFPSSVVSHALQVSDRLVQLSELKEQESKRTRDQQGVRVYHRLVQARVNSRLPEMELRKYLKGLQDELY